MTYKPLIPATYLPLWDVLSFIGEVSTVGQGSEDSHWEGEQGPETHPMDWEVLGRAKPILDCLKFCFPTLELRVKKTNWC